MFFNLLFPLFDRAFSSFFKAGNSTETSVIADVKVTIKKSKGVSLLSYF